MYGCQPARAYNVCFFISPRNWSFIDGVCVCVCAIAMSPFRVRTVETKIASVRVQKYMVL